ncbi:MAG: Na+/H+ antiporter NhaC family protein [Psychromonas sp.]
MSIANMFISGLGLDKSQQSNTTHLLKISSTIAVLICFTAIGLTHEAGTSYGWLSVLPTTMVLFFALTTHRTVEALFLGAVIGLLMLEPSNIVGATVDLSQNVLSDPTIVWIILVCSLMGGLIAVLEKGGSILSFSGALVSVVKSRKQSMLLTFALGILIFIDDYLNAIAISSTMKSVTDKYNISREKLAYLVDSTAAPICIIVPISTWAIFFSGLLEANDAAAAGQGLNEYIKAIPYMAYGWVTLVIVLLVSFDKIPNLGSMKAAEERAANGQTIPDGAESIALDETTSAKKTSTFMGILNFILPMVVLVVASWLYGIDLLAGVIVALIFTFSLYGVQGIISMNSMFDAVFDGIKIMILPLATVICGFMLKDVNDSLGLTVFMIESISPYLSAQLFPALIFLIAGALVFATASSWGVFAVAMPIVLPIGESLGVPLHLTIGALLSASAAGSHSCFFSDSTVLSAQGSGCTAMQHARTQFPYAVIGIVFTTIFFLIVA